MCRSCELRSAKRLQERGQSLCVTSRTLLRAVQAEVPLGVASSEGIEKCSPSWLPKDILTLVPFMQEGFWGPTAAPDRRGPRLVPFKFGFLHAEPQVA